MASETNTLHAFQSYLQLTLLEVLGTPTDVLLEVPRSGFRPIVTQPAYT